MTFKDRDIAVAVALMLQGFMRANGDAALGTAVSAARREVSDWAENLMPESTEAFDPNAIEPNALSVDVLVMGLADAPRTPYNLTSAALVLLAEAIDLNGPEAIKHLRDRIAATYPPEAEVPPGELQMADGAVALEPAAIRIDLWGGRGAGLPRSPHNLVSAAISLLVEAKHVGGIEALGDFEERRHASDC